jgi:hypothetical protein
MTEQQLHEFRSLRDTVASRGHLRATLTLAGIGVWAVVLTAILIALPFPVAAVIPLTVLLATFEAIRPLHFGAERIGRYIQVFHEEPNALADSSLSPPAWERTAMVFGSSLPGAAGHPLAAPLLAIATVVNLLAVVLPEPLPVELALIGLPHLALLTWLARSDRAMRTQRPTELARYRELRDRGGPLAR